MPVKYRRMRKLNTLEMGKDIEIMENISMKKESLEWIAFKVFLVTMVAYGALIITVLIAG